MKKRFQVIPAVYLVLERDGRILLARRFKTGYMDGAYSMIAGHLDGDESLRVALAREALEEAGIIVSPSSMELVHTMHTKSELPGTTDDERIDFYFAAHVFKGHPRIMETNKCDDMAWFNPNKLPDNMVPRVRVALAHIAANHKYSELGW